MCIGVKRVGRMSGKVDIQESWKLFVFLIFLFFLFHLKYKFTQNLQYTWFKMENFAILLASTPAAVYFYITNSA